MQITNEMRAAGRRALERSRLRGAESVAEEVFQAMLDARAEPASRPEHTLRPIHTSYSPDGNSPL